MSIVETVLVFVVAPGILVAAIAVPIFGMGAARAPRYRPGRDWPHEPVWYAPHPQAVRDSAHDEHESAVPALPPSESASGSASGSAADSTPVSRSRGGDRAVTAAGGARGTW